MSDTLKPTAADAYDTMEALLCEMQGLRDELVETKKERDEAREDANYAEKESSRMRSALQRLADCDWVITPHDRMDAVRKIARDALEAANPTTKSKQVSSKLVVIKTASNL